MRLTNIRIATTDQWYDKQSEERMERTEWHRVVFFGRLAEIAAEHLRKGSQCYVEGRIQTRKWQTQDGQDRYSTEIIASEVQFLGGRPPYVGGTHQTEHHAAASAATPDAPHLDAGPPTHAQQNSQPQQGPDQPKSAAKTPPFDDDDIPF